MDLSPDTSSAVADTDRAPSSDYAPSLPVRRRRTTSASQSTTRSEWTTVLTLFAGDALGIFLTFAATYLTALWVAPEAASRGFSFSVLISPVFFALFSLLGFYRLSFIHPALEAKQVASVTGTMGVAATLTTYLADGTLTTTLLVGTGTLLGTVFLPVCRVFARVLFARLSWWGVPAVVISSGEDGRAILNTLEKWPEIGLRPVAFLSDETGPEELNFALGDQDWAPYLAQTFDISHAIISVPDLSHSERAKLLAHYSKFFDHVFVAAEASGSPALWKTGQRGGGLRGHGVCYPLSNPGTQAVKRAADLIGATLALLCLVPVFAVLGLLIRLDSAGPMFYCQERLGAEGQIFTLLKFRTTATPRRGCRECSTRTPIGASDTNSTTSSTTTRA